MFTKKNGIKGIMTPTNKHWDRMSAIPLILYKVLAIQAIKKFSALDF